MTVLRLKYVQVVHRKGKRFFYFRRPGHPRAPLPGLPGSVTFMKAYEKALAATPETIGSTLYAPDSMIALASSYFKSPEFKGLRPTSQSTYRNTIERFNIANGHNSYRSLNNRAIEDIMYAMSDKPGAANHLLKALRALMGHAYRTRRISVNPTVGVKKLVYKKARYPAWKQAHIEQFKAHWPLGTQARLAIVLLATTGVRRSDAIRLGPSNIRSGRIEFTQQKTGGELSIPMRPSLREAIDAMPVRSMETFLLTAHGRPFASTTAFYNRFKAWSAAAGIPDNLSPHGLRRAAAVELAHAGCTVPEIQSITGHESAAMVMEYIREFEKERMSDTATERVEAALKGKQ